MDIIQEAKTISAEFKEIEADRRNMIMYSLNRNEIKLFSTINTTIQICTGGSTFLIGFVLSSILSKLSIPADQYKLTPLAGIFPWIVYPSVIIAVVLIIIAAVSAFKGKKDVMDIINEETDGYYTRS